jgi:hypothetical protein
MKSMNGFCMLGGSIRVQIVPSPCQETFIIVAKGLFVHIVEKLTHGRSKRGMIISGENGSLQRSQEVRNTCTAYCRATESAN